MHENLSLFTTSLDKALDPRSATNVYGILDLPSVFIKEIPEFTEEITVQAMKNLGISPDELVFDDMSTYSGDQSMRFQISLDMEKQRLLKIQKIIKLRESLAKEGVHVKPQPKKLKKAPKKQNTLLLNSTRRYPGNNYRSKSTARSTKSYDYAQVQSNNSKNNKNDITKYNNLGKIIEIQRKTQEDIIKQKAQLRLKHQKEECAMIEARREKSRALTQLELKKQAQVVNKLHEQKIKKYEEEMKWRLANIYKSGHQQAPHSKINAMRKNLKQKGRNKSSDADSVLSNDSLFRNRNQLL